MDVRIYIGGVLSEEAEAIDSVITGYMLKLTRADYLQGSLSMVQSAMLDGGELAIDEFYVTLCTDALLERNPHALDHLLDAGTQPTTETLPALWTQRLEEIPYGEVIWYVRQRDDGRVEVDKFYMKTLNQVGRYDFELTAQSAMGLLDDSGEQGSVGGMYNGEPLGDVLKEIMGDIPYTVEGDSVNAETGETVYGEIGEIKVYGYLPVASRRDNLHDVLLAYGIVIRRNAAGDTHFARISEEIKEIGDKAIFLDGASVERNRAAVEIIVTETQYFQTFIDQETTLYDSTKNGSADQTRTIFSNAPVYDLTATNSLKMSPETNCNYTILTGNGILTGKPYTMTQREVGIETGYFGLRKTVPLKASGMLQSLNSYFVAMRLRNIYQSARMVTMDIERNEERPGDLVKFRDPYINQPLQGFITSMHSRITSFERVTVKILCVDDANAIAQYWGNAWNYVRVISGPCAGVWTVPEEFEGQTIRVILISGGNGGASGVHGTDYYPSSPNKKNRAYGGEAGTPGKGGKILILNNLTLRAGEQIPFCCGYGGYGGLPTSRWEEQTESEEPKPHYVSLPGDSGGNTRFGSFSSSAGVENDVGYFEILSNSLYASQGADNGIPGGEANTSGEPPVVKVPWSRMTFYAGAIGQSAYRQNGDIRERATGGCGGGAAVGNDGKSGADANTNSAASDGGIGGDGAHASAWFPSSTRFYGDGGSGGHGGGSAGEGGYGELSGWSKQYSNAGQGGYGSAGQDGMPGCILIFSKQKLQWNVENAGFHLISPDEKKEMIDNSITLSDSSPDTRLNYCIVEIKPKQEGSGEVSPDNPRLITGWSNVTITWTNGDQSTEVSISLEPRQPLNDFAADASTVTGQVYGGNLDVPKGILTVRQSCLTLNGSERWEREGGGVTGEERFFKIGAPSDMAGTGRISDLLCSHFPVDGDNEEAPFMTFTNEYTNEYPNGYFKFYTTGTKTINGWKSWLEEQRDVGTPVQVLYPIDGATYQISPEALFMRRGTNKLSASMRSLYVEYREDPELIYERLKAEINTAD